MFYMACIAVVPRLRRKNVMNLPLSMLRPVLLVVLAVAVAFLLKTM